MRLFVTVVTVSTMLEAFACLTAGCSESFTAAAVADVSDGAGRESGEEVAASDSGGGDVESGSPGGPVAPTFGALSTVGPAIADAGAAESGGGGLTLTDDGFEMDDSRCNGNVCVQGSIRP
jgi:hypothetical protein